MSKSISAAENKSTIILSGILWKKHRKNQFWSGWHNRFFVLESNGRLNYYKNSKRKRKRGTVHLSTHARIVRSGKSSRHNFWRFEVYTANGQVILLAGDDEKKANKWIDVLERTIATADDLIDEDQDDQDGGMEVSDVSDPDDEGNTFPQTDDENGEEEQGANSSGGGSGTNRTYSSDKPSTSLQALQSGEEEPPAMATTKSMKNTSPKTNSTTNTNTTNQPTFSSPSKHTYSQSMPVLKLEVNNISNNLDSSNNNNSAYTDALERPTTPGGGPSGGGGGSNKLKMLKEGFLFRRPGVGRWYNPAKGIVTKKIKQKLFRVKSWHRRYFTLSHDGRLEWYKINLKSGHRLNNLRGTVMMGGDCVVEFNRTKKVKGSTEFWPFSLLLGTESRLNLGAETIEEAESWVILFRSLITKFQEGSTTLSSTDALKTPTKNNSNNSSKTKSKRINTRKSHIMMDLGNEDDVEDEEDSLPGTPYKTPSKNTSKYTSKNKLKNIIENDNNNNNNNNNFDDNEEDNVSNHNHSSSNVLDGMDMISEDGWLLRQNTFVKYSTNRKVTRWNRKYFVLNGTRLGLFKTSRSSRASATVDIGSDCRVDFPARSISCNGRTVWPFTLFSEKEGTRQTMVKGALHLAAFTQESARRWVSALRLGSVSAPRERSNTFLEKLSAKNLDVDQGQGNSGNESSESHKGARSRTTNGSTTKSRARSNSQSSQNNSNEDDYGLFEDTNTSHSGTMKREAPMPGQPLHFGDHIRLYTKSAFIKEDEDDPTMNQGGHIGIYESNRARRKYGGFIFAVPPIGNKAEFIFTPSTFIILKPNVSKDVLHQQDNQNSDVNNMEGENPADASTNGTVKYSSELESGNSESEKEKTDTEEDSNLQSNPTPKIINGIIISPPSNRKKMKKNIRIAKTKTSKMKNKKIKAKAKAIKNSKKNSKKKNNRNIQRRDTAYTIDMTANGMDNNTEQVCYGDSFILVDVVTGMSANNSFSFKSGYLGPREMCKKGQVTFIMGRVNGREGDPITYGDTNVVITAKTSIDEKRFTGRLANYRKNTSKTKGGYVVCGYNQPRTGPTIVRPVRGRSTPAKDLLFRIDGESKWEGVDLTKTYTLRATNCISGPTRMKEDGTKGTTDHVRIDDWWGPIQVGSSSTFARLSSPPCVEIALNKRSKLIRSLVPKCGPTSKPGKRIRSTVPGVPSIEAEWKYKGVLIPAFKKKEWKRTLKQGMTLVMCSLIIYILSNYFLVDLCSNDSNDSNGCSYDSVSKDDFYYRDLELCLSTTSVMFLLGAFQLLCEYYFPQRFQIKKNKKNKNQHQNNTSHEENEKIYEWYIRIVTYGTRKETSKSEDLTNDTTAATNTTNATDSNTHKRNRSSSKDDTDTNNGNDTETGDDDDQTDENDYNAIMPIICEMGTTVRKVINTTDDVETEKIKQTIETKMETMNSTTSTTSEEEKAMKVKQEIFKLQQLEQNRSSKESTQWIPDMTFETCPASQFNVRYGPTILEYKKTRKKMKSNASMYETLHVDMNQTKLKPSHIVDHITFNPSISAIISDRHRLCQKHGITIPTVLIVTMEMPNYKPPNPLWGGSTYNGLSFNLIFVSIVSETYILQEGGKKDPSHDLWLKVCQGEEEKIQERMKLICSLRNGDEFAVNAWDRGLLNKFNATPLLVKPQHEFLLGTLDRRLHQVDADDVTYCDYVIDVHCFPFIARKTANANLERMHVMEVDFGLVVEGREDESLPERMLMCTHLKEIEVTRSKQWGANNSVERREGGVGMD